VPAAMINYSLVKFGTAVGTIGGRYVVDKPTPLLPLHERPDVVTHGYSSVPASGVAGPEKSNAGGRREFPVAAGVDYKSFNAWL
jgi:hypothetical protein